MPSTSSLVTVALVGAVIVAIYAITHLPMKTVTCQGTATVDGRRLPATSKFRIDFERSLLDTPDGDKPIQISPEQIYWKESGKADAGRRTFEEEVTINRQTGELFQRRVLKSSNGEPFVTSVSGACTGA